MKNEPIQVDLKPAQPTAAVWILSWFLGPDKSLDSVFK